MYEKKNEKNRSHADSNSVKHGIVSWMRRQRSNYGINRNN